MNNDVIYPTMVIRSQAETIELQEKEIDRLNNEIKILLQENNNKEKVIIKQENILNELEKYIDDNYFYDDIGMKIFDVSLLEDKLNELKDSGNNE